MATPQFYMKARSFSNVNPYPSWKRDADYWEKDVSNNLYYMAGNVGIGYSVPRGGLVINGNVGIGTNYPQAKLDIRGDGSFSGNLGVGKTPSVALDVSGIVITNQSSQTAALGFRNYVGTNFIGIGASLPSTSYSNITNAGDCGIIFSDGTMGSGNLVIAPWSTTNVGIRVKASGGIDLYGNIYLVNGTLRQSGEIRVVNRRPIFIKNMTGGQTYNLNSTPTLITPYVVYGPYNTYADSQIQPAAGATRYYRVYACYSDNITNGVSWYIRIVSNTNSSNFIDYTMGATYGGQNGETRDFYSNYSTTTFGGHANVQVWAPASATGNGTINISYIELQSLDIYT